MNPLTYTDFENGLVSSVRGMAGLVGSALKIHRGGFETWALLQYLLLAFPGDELERLDYYRELACDGEGARRLLVDLAFNTNEVHEGYRHILVEWKVNQNINTLSRGAGDDVDKLCELLPYYEKSTLRPYPVVVGIGPSTTGAVGVDMRQVDLNNGFSLYITTPQTWIARQVLSLTAFGSGDSGHAVAADTLVMSS